MKEVLLVLATLWFLFHFTRPKVILPDILLVSAFLMVLFEQIFHPNLKGLRDDWEWILLYALGRVLVLAPETQATWARCAVWMCAALSMLGVWEVQMLGSAPRLLLLQSSFGDTTLPASFVATGYAGFRAASTMASPLAFACLCGVALMLWWAYMKNPIPGILIAVGLLFTLTRSAIFAVVLCIPILALLRRERVRLMVYGLVVAAGVAFAIPALDLGDFLRASFNSGADTSTTGHSASISNGFAVILMHPLGLGAGTIGPHVVISNSDALNIESTFLTLGAEYGVVVGCLFLAFIAFCLLTLLRSRQPIAYVASCILLVFTLMMAFLPMHQDIPLSCWVWVPIGMALTQVSTTGTGYQPEIES